MDNQQIIFTNQPEKALDKVVADINPKGVFVLVDSNTAQFVLPRLRDISTAVSQAVPITVPAGEGGKSIDSASRVWTALMQGGASRNSLLINLGGGVITDLGGFCAATYKRGMHCVNVPTTLLGAVDAAVGGKTGVNFRDLKNIIGVFRQPQAVIISAVFFNTLNHQELMSGYGEIIKHAMLAGSAEFDSVMDFSFSGAGYDPDSLLELLRKSVAVKEAVVRQDPTETGLRKQLNLGHTIGHTFESLALKRKSPVAHGYAVAWGLVAESVLSHLYQGLPTDVLNRLADYVRTNYGVFSIDCKDYPALIAAMRQDKKNADADHINFTLLKALGQPVIDVTVDSARIEGALDVYRDLMHI